MKLPMPKHTKTKAVNSENEKEPFPERLPVDGPKAVQDLSATEAAGRNQQSGQISPKVSSNHHNRYSQEI